MFSFVTPFGFPFDPTTDAVFPEIPRSARLTGELKKASKANYAKESTGAIKSRYDVLFMPAKKYSFEAFNNNFILSDVDRNDFNKDLDRHLKLIAKLPVKRRNRYFLANDDMYFAAMREAMEKSKLNFTEDKTLARVGIDAYCKKHLGIDDFFDKESAFPVIEKLAGNIDFGSEEIEKAVFMMKMDMALASDNTVGATFIKMLLDLSISDLEQGKNIKDAVTCIWSIGETYNCINVFFLLYYLFKDLITPELFPFLRFSILNEVVNQNLSNLESLDSFYSSVVVYEIGRNADSEGEIVEIHNVLSSVFENKYAFIDKKRISQSFIKRVNEISREMISMVSFYDKAAYDDYMQDYKDRDTNVANELNLSLITSLEHDIRLKYENIVIEHGLELSPVESIAEAQEKIKDLELESLELAGNPLDNIDKLTSLSTERNKLESEILESKNIGRKVGSEIIDSFNLVQEFISKSLNQNNTKVCEGESNKDLLDGAIKELSQNNIVINELSKKVSSLESQLFESNRMLDEERSSSFVSSGNLDTSSAILRIFDGNSTALDVINAIVEINGENLRMPKSLLKEVGGMVEFNKNELLFRKLLLLTSKKFIEMYNSEGSIGCFNLFTKNELSFQETKATQKLHPRLYVVNGKEYDCKAHLKIGADNTEQNMLRIYFAIDGDKIIIGDIIRHLKTAKAI